MATITIGSMTNRLRMPAGVWSHRARLARIFDEAVFDLLESALTESGVDFDVDVCIRHVDAFIRIRMTGTDHAVARAWSQALAQAIRRAAAGVHPDLVCYRSRSQALVDLVSSVLAQDDSRTWAWAQLGLWTTRERAGTREAVLEVMRALTLHPRLAISVLSAAARHNDLERLFADAPPEAWVDLARAILIELAGSVALLRADLEDVQRADLDERAVAADGSIERQADRILDQSCLATGFLRSPNRFPGAAAVRSMALLAIVEVEPWRFQDERHACRLAAALTHALAPKTQDHREPAPSSSSRIPATTPTQSRDAEAPERTTATRADPPAISHFGGLLFFLHLVGACDLARLMGTDERLGSRSLRWILHQLAIVLTGCVATDPAALAFAGLPPSAAPPDRDEPPVSDVEAAAISGYAQQLVDRLAEIFADDEQSREPLALAGWMCERAAEVVADPGWIEARFQHNSADTSIRRRGLDVNPDFLPWLGVIVRFAYV